MDPLYSHLADLLGNKMVLTLLSIISLTVIRTTILRLIRKDSNFLSEQQRKWISRTKNWGFVFLLLLLFVIWQAEIREFALSLTAIAVAVVVASKEIILCFTGSIQRASSRSFQIGDWIEVGNLYGEVIEYNIMATKIQELDIARNQYAYTGKTVTLPNSMFFTQPVKNMNFMKRYVYHRFAVVLRDTHNLYPLLPTLQQRIEVHCEGFADVAKRYNHVIERHAGVDLPGAEPQITIDTSEIGDTVVSVTLFCPTDRAVELEQRIREEILELFFAASRNASPTAVSEPVNRYA